MECINKQKVEARKNELISGLALLYIQKEEIENKINSQRVAINEADIILNMVEAGEKLTEPEAKQDVL